MSTPLLVSHFLLWFVVALLTVVTLAAVRQIGLIHKRIPPVGARMAPVGPNIGDEAPGFDEPDLSGRPTSLGSARGKKTLLVFLSTRCSTCKDIAPAVRAFARSEARKLETILICDGAVDDCREYARRYGLAHIPVVVSPKLEVTYNISTTPYGLLVDESQKVTAKGVVNSREHLDSLVRAAELGVDSFETLAEKLGSGLGQDVEAAVGSDRRSP